MIKLNKKEAKFLAYILNIQDGKFYDFINYSELKLFFEAIRILGEKLQKEAEDDRCTSDDNISAMDGAVNIIKKHKRVTYNVFWDNRNDCYGITCLICKKFSYNDNDIKEKYCAKCKMFHQDITEPIPKKIARPAQPVPDTEDVEEKNLIDYDWSNGTTEDINNLFL